MGLINDKITVCVTAADPIKLINDCASKGFVLENVVFLDELTIRITLSSKDYPHFKHTIENQSCEYKVFNDSAFRLKLRIITGRPVLIFAILCILLFTLFLPTRVLFVHVTGNWKTPAALILEKASEGGIHFGSSRRAIRSEFVKNKLIEELPQLQWVGVTTNGCVATIHVIEKSVKPNSKDNTKSVSSIVASRDGVILTCTVMKGTPLCQTGQVVTEGEVLVSGYTDCGIYVQATTAKAEVLAQTKRRISLISPINVQQRLLDINNSSRYSIRFGKNIIKLWKDSGIRDATYVKICNERYLTLPGGFVLPVSLITERTTSCKLKTGPMSRTDWLSEFSEGYISQQMVAGQIIDKHEQLETHSGLYKLTTQYNCTEMIGQTKHEEITQDYGND